MYCPLRTVRCLEIPVSDFSCYIPDQVITVPGQAVEHPFAFLFHWLTLLCQPAGGIVAVQGSDSVFICVSAGVPFSVYLFDDVSMGIIYITLYHSPVWCCDLYQPNNRIRKYTALLLQLTRYARKISFVVNIYKFYCITFKSNNRSPIIR